MRAASRVHDSATSGHSGVVPAMIRVAAGATTLAHAPPFVTGKVVLLGLAVENGCCV